jgi:hypothetical protein
VNPNKRLPETHHDLRASLGGLPKGILIWPVYRASLERQLWISLKKSTCNWQRLQTVSQPALPQRCSQVSAGLSK